MAGLLVPATYLTLGGVAGFFLRKLSTAAAKPSKIQIVYFPVRARAEAPRLILEYGGVDYEDITAKDFCGEGWPGAKPFTPFGQLPVMVVDGEVIAQSGSIVRYCAKLVPALVPTDAIAAAKCDMIFEAGQEMTAVNPVVNIFKGAAFAKKKEAFFKDFPPKLANLAKLLDKSDGPFFLGATPYYCDLGVFHQLDNCRSVEPECLAAYPKVVAFMAAVEALPAIKKYLAARPKCVDIGSAPMLSPPIVGSRVKK